MAAHEHKSFFSHVSFSKLHRCAREHGQLSDPAFWKVQHLTVDVCVPMVTEDYKGLTLVPYIIKRGSSFKYLNKILT